MATNPTNFSGWADNTQGMTTASQESALGFPGKYHSAVIVAAGTTASFTGSQFGYGAFMIGDGAEIAATHIETMGGARIEGTDLAKEVVYDIVPKQVAAATGVVYVFKVQG